MSAFALCDESAPRRGTPQGRQIHNTSENTSKIPSNKRRAAITRTGTRKWGVALKIPAHNPTPVAAEWIDPPGFADALRLHMTRFQESYVLLHRAIVRPGETFDRATIKAWSSGRRTPRSVASMGMLAREHDAVAAIEYKHLIFAPKGPGQTSTGVALPGLSIRRRAGDRHKWQRQKRDWQDGVTASWHDRRAEKRQTVTMGISDGAKKLRKVYPDEASAKRAAAAETSRLKRAPATFDMTLALGRADAYPEAHVQVIGFKAGIDGTIWLISEVTHRLDKRGGFRTDLRMEMAP